MLKRLSPAAMIPVSMFSSSLKSRSARDISPRAVMSVIAVLLGLTGTAPARAQELGGDAAKRCSQAAQVLRAYDEAVVRSGGHANEGGGKAEQRQLAVAQLLSCGALGGAEAASTIRLTRALADPAMLNVLVGPFDNFRDTAVVSAVMTVAADASASVPARVFALRSMWVLQTGKFWVGYEELIPRRASPGDASVATCGRGLRVAEAKPTWSIGAEPKAGFEVALRALAQKLKADATQPVVVRAAAGCVLYP
ncbi:MAG: hypothetical protein ACYC3L_07400 [Gemmatimonadaceae bacterium]